MPLTCSAIHRSPTLIFPENEVARELFGLLGTVYGVEEEEHFIPATAVAAFYGWIYALFGETVAWTTREGVPPDVARGLVLETARGAAEMGLMNPEQELSKLLDSLATPGGITRHGLEVLEEEGSLRGWSRAMDAVLERMR
jgi:pyrroline-5-carboxylate reductase